jgi:DivIVA domain-containing protein
MDHDDPEERIAELERQLAEQERAAGPEYSGNLAGVTAEDIHAVAFSHPARGHRGYNEDDVDALLERIEATLRDPTVSGAVTSADIHNVTFSKPPIGKRGYDEVEVDALLGRVAIELGRRGDPGQTGAQQGLGGTPDSGPRHLKPSNESTARKILDHVGAFVAELSPNNHTRFTWRTPLAIGLVFLLLGFAVHPAYLVVGVGLLICSALAWRFSWGG